MAKRRVSLLIGLTAFLLTQGALNAAPNTIRFQGRLTDNQGNPIVGPDVKVRFGLYSVLTGGSAAWETATDQTVTTNEAGLFSTDIGPLSSALFVDNAALYLQVSVNDGTSFKTLSPRQKLSTVPYSFYAETVPNHSISPLQLQDKSLTETQIADHAIGTNTVNASISNYLIPTGMVAMFMKACPDGWAAVPELNNRFPMGVADAANIKAGGSSVISGLTTVSSGTHSHMVDAHAHSIPSSAIEHKHLTPAVAYSGTGNLYGSAKNPFGLGGDASTYDVGTHAGVFTPQPNLVFEKTSGITDYTIGNTGPASSKTDVADNHTHTVASDGSWSPPYYGVMYCAKE